MCRPGYTGPHCEQDINECASEPCLNGGQCLNQLNAYSCNCTDTGFTGEVCQSNINECLQSPCVYGSCSDTEGSYECACQAGYCGTNCQRENPCLLVSLIIWMREIFADSGNVFLSVERGIVRKRRRLPAIL